ncbi:flagellar assembly protein H [Exiguobacterium aurantiacum]|uniref:Flagellar assembly protein H n=1 Tax=Exiguobacterium aurantiacum TaxID=33987 RepID=A0A377FVF2_9BACL|nr:MULTISPECIES: FliH/SctL family protein [Exiguobacterium]STO08466.1 flagellar assembly protein H [Exiguobacterium aurantiacum]
MTSLSSVIKRGRATSLRPQRIDSKPLFETVDVLPEVDHESEIADRYEKLKQEEAAANERLHASQEALERLKDDTLAAAYEEGRAAGFAQGQTEGKAEFEELTTRLNTVLVELERLYDDKWRSAEQHLVALAVEVGAKLTTDLVRKEETLFADMIRQQLLRELDAESLTVYVHPTRLASIQRFESTWRSEQTPLLKYRADASLSETSVRIETPQHGTELDLSYSLERIRSNIEEVLADGAY